MGCISPVISHRYTLLCKLHCTLPVLCYAYFTHWTPHTKHIINWAHCTQNRLHSSYFPLNSTPSIHCPLRTAHFTLHTSNCTLHTAHCTLFITHYTPHTAQCTPHTTQYTLPNAHWYYTLLNHQSTLKCLESIQGSVKGQKGHQQKIGDKGCKNLTF